MSKKGSHTSNVRYPPIPIPTAHGSINRLAGEAFAGNGKYLTFLRLTFDKEKSVALKKSS